MDEVIIADLKQFILATVSQATANLATKDELQVVSNRMATKADFQTLETKMDKRFDELELKVDTIADAHSELLAEHDKAIKQLQQQVR